MLRPRPCPTRAWVLARLGGQRLSAPAGALGACGRRARYRLVPCRQSSAAHCLAPVQNDLPPGAKWTIPAASVSALGLHVSGSDGRWRLAGREGRLDRRRASRKRGVHVAVEYSGSLGALQAAIRTVAFGGNVVAGAFPPAYSAGLDLGGEAHINISNMIFWRACPGPAGDEAVRRSTCRGMFARCLATGIVYDDARDEARRSRIFLAAGPGGRACPSSSG